MHDLAERRIAQSDPVDMRDPVARSQIRALGRCPVERRYHDHAVALLGPGNLDSQTAELTAHRIPDYAIFIARQVSAVGIE